MTKMQVGLTGALALTGATGFMVQARTAATLREEAAELRRENAAIHALESENLRLARLATEVAGLRRDDAEFARLQEEAGVLRKRLQEIARAEQERAKAAQAAQVFEISMLDQTPRPRFQRRPQYPFELRRAGISGEVVVDFVVDANGDVRDARALRSTRKEFEAAAVEAVSGWKFAAGKKGGRDVATHLQVPMVFSLGDDAARDSGEAAGSTAAGAGGDREAKLRQMQESREAAVERAIERQRERKATHEAAETVRLTPFVTQSTLP